MNDWAILKDVQDGLPSATLVIPCFNHGKFVGEAVRSCLAQVGARVRVVVVNDGSTDGVTPGACEACKELGPGVTVIHQGNRGLPAARNAGARVARDEGWTEYLVFLDADDWIEPAFVATLAAAVRSAGDPAVSHAYCQERLVDQAKGVWQVPAWDPLLLLVTNLHPVTALIRRSAFEAVGGFDETLTRGYEDWDLWLRMCERDFRGVRVREPLFVWRRHSEQTMVMEAVRRHEELFATLIDRHPQLYALNARAIIERSNVLLRRADANWLDENHEAIFIRDLRTWNLDLVQERDQAWQQVERLRAQLDEAERAILDYERKPSVRLARAVFRVVDRLPAPLAMPVRLGARTLRWMLNSSTRSRQTAVMQSESASPRPDAALRAR